MKKIPTIFERDWDGDRSRVIDERNPDCTWVFMGAGWPTRKLDGTSCMVDADGLLYKRRELRIGDQLPVGFQPIDVDQETGKTVGWLPVGDGPEDRWHREAFMFATPGTYELIGPKIQGNPEGSEEHVLVPHNLPTLRIDDVAVPRTFDGLKEYLAEHDIEGIVFHHPDGRMAKIKKRDFGLKRGK